MKMKEDVKHALEIVHEPWNSAEDFSREEPARAGRLLTPGNSYQPETVQICVVRSAAA